MSDEERKNVSRADQIRSRRMNKTDRQNAESLPKDFSKSSAAERPHAPASRQQVTSRYQPPRQPQQQYTAQNRRKVYMKLNTPGAEVRLPSMPTMQLGWRYASIALLVVLLIALYAFFNLSSFLISKPTLVGAVRITAEDMAPYLDVIGVSPITIKPAEVEQEIAAKFADLESVKVTVGLPASLFVEVVERKPVLFLQYPDGSVKWVDMNGYIFPARGDSAMLPGVAVNGELPIPPSNPSASTAPTSNPAIQQERVEPAFVSAALSLTLQIPPETILVYDPAYGLGWTDPQGWLVYFGTNTDNIALKLEEYQLIIDELNAKGIRPALISLKYLHAPFIRMEQ